MPERTISRAGRRAVSAIEDVGLLAILLATVVAAAQEVGHMIALRAVGLADLLLMFIYLEVVAMVAAYWQSGQLPVRMPLYIGMVALARYLILDMKDMSSWRIMAISGGVLLLAIAVLIIRYGHSRYPYDGQSVADDSRPGAGRGGRTGR